MQNITIIAMGKVQKGFMLDGCNEYIKRLGPMCNLKIVQLEDVQLMEKNLSDAMIQKTLEKEADEIIKNISDEKRKAIIKTSHVIDERKYQQLSPEDKTLFADARTITPGKAKFKISIPNSEEA